ncbi:LAME_0G10946g1_1 [Lachancea meyersii CBS 8951]|uniref:LAME_0G10946g1_1 n=1 Tax=Lachancea meyersii CBS 8951 TaxID=1266667 RepID=A0A1G4K961_9SACH|nr:LAME_0G10946g1_1 [Lachancea meyersii CBS 8951]
MDTVKSINKLRASFLHYSSDAEQAKRIIKPFLANPQADVELPSELQKLYRLENGEDYLTSLESPPISENYMAKIESLQKARFNQKTPVTSDVNVPDAPRPTPVHTENHDQSTYDSKVPKSDEKDTTERPRSTSSAASKRTASLTTIRKTSQQSLQRNESSVTPSRSCPPQDPKLKKNALFSRIFKGHTNSDLEERKTSLTRSHPKSSRTNSSGAQNTNLRFYDSAFDYDETLEDDDEDDDDDDVEQNDEFFLGGLPKSDDAKQSKPLKLGNLPRYAQNVLSSSDAKSNLLLNVIDRKVASSGDEADTRKSSSRDDQVSELDSYMDENDLKELDLDGEKLGASHGEENHTSGRKASTAGAVNNGEIDKNRSGDESFTSSELSSYGRSLLDSDIDDLDNSSYAHKQMAEGSLLEDSMIADEILRSDSMPGHSVPRSHAFKLMDESQQSAFISEEPPLKLGDYKKANSSIGSSARNSFQGESNEKRGYAQLPSPSNSTVRLSKGSLQANVGGGLNGAVKNWARHRRTASDHTKSLRPANPNFDPSVFTKISLSGTEHQGASQLTNILQEKKTKVSNSIDYFAFVSGNQVPNPESTTLDVYIQDSLKYKKHPLIINVRKSATAFEVIGYILYQYFSQIQSLEDGNGLIEKELRSPNQFKLKIVDEDGEPFEDNFGTIDRQNKIGSIFDNEVVLCKVQDALEFRRNEVETPLPYGEDGSTSEEAVDAKISTDGTINQLSYYKPILKTHTKDTKSQNGKLVDVKIFLFPNLNPAYNYTTIREPISTSLKAILSQYCTMKSMDASDYTLKICGKRLVVDLEDSLGELDGNFELELITKKEVKALALKKMNNATFGKPVLPTIQSADLTPVAMDDRNHYLAAVDTLKGPEGAPDPNANSKHTSLLPSKKGSIKSKRGLSKLSQVSDSSGGAGGFFKLKNNSKSSLRNSGASNRPSSERSELNLDTSYKDVFAGAYYKYKVWRRQQISFINKHERTLAIDGDYIYIIPPENGFNWHHEHAKTKCFHMSQVVLIRKSKRIPEYFKIFVNRPTGLKRYFFEATSSAECVELVSRVQSLLSAYKMNHRDTN